MKIQCDACQRVYELNRQDVRCVYCGEYRCHPVEETAGVKETESEQ